MLRMLQFELAYPSEFQFIDNFRFELRLARSSSHSSIRSIDKALSQRPYAMMTSEAFDLGGGTVSRGFWVTFG